MTISDPADFVKKMLNSLPREFLEAVAAELVANVRDPA